MNVKQFYISYWEERIREAKENPITDVNHWPYNNAEWLKNCEQELAKWRAHNDLPKM